MCEERDSGGLGSCIISTIRGPRPEFTALILPQAGPTSLDDALPLR